MQENPIDRDREAYSAPDPCGLWGSHGLDVQSRPLRFGFIVRTESPAADFKEKHQNDQPILRNNYLISTKLSLT